MSQPHEESAKLFAAIGKTTVYRGAHLPPNVQWHVCSTRPVPNAVNHENTCLRCGCKVYSRDAHPKLKKICAPCATKLAEGPGIESVTNEDAIAKTILHLQQLKQQRN